MEITGKHNKPRYNNYQTLPDDIVFFDIFPRLPVDSLHRFRAVSRLSRALTSDPRFLAAVRRLSLRRRFLLSFTSSHETSDKFVRHSINPDDPHADVVIVQKPKNPNLCAYAKFINGLICFVSGENVVVSNPASNDRFVLSLMDAQYTYTHFCYDLEIDTYKVLTMTTTRVDGDVAKLKCSIFTLGVDQSWRDIDSPNNDLQQLGKSRSVCIDGVLYCTNFSTSREIEDGVIVAFIVKTELFYRVKYPKGLSASRHSYCHVIEAKGALAIVDVQDFKNCTISLWIKKGVDRYDEPIWIEHRIEIERRWKTYFYLTRHFSFSTNGAGEIVMGLLGRLRPKCLIFVYNMEKEKWRRIQVVRVHEDLIGVDDEDDNLHMNISDFFVEEYVETPLLLGDILNKSS